MPNKQDLSKFPFQINVWNKMANALGGDYYEALQLTDTTFLVGCFDVSGKNVAASLLTVALGSFFKMIKNGIIKITNPINIISTLDKFLEDTVPVGSFITAAICYINIEKKYIQLFNCGHTSIYLFSKNIEKSNTIKVGTKIGRESCRDRVLRFE